MGKIMKLISAAAVVLLSVAPSAAQQDVTVQTGEYWLDGDFGRRQAFPLSGTWQTTLDVSALPEGLHTLGFRAADSRGRWSVPVLRYFLHADRFPSGSVAGKYEMWIDRDFDRRTSGSLQSGVLDTVPDFSALVPGLHTLSVRATDSHGRWSVPYVKYFLKTVASSFGDNVVTGCCYSIDGVNAVGVSVAPVADGVQELSLDVSGLTPGLHTLACLFEDARGRLNAPLLKYFVVPDTLPADNAVTAYEYWFNAGRRTRVEVEPENPLVLKDVEIAIEDVVPHEITDGYRFDVASGTVYCDDSVHFGIVACDRAGHTTGAVLSDTFPMTVPVQVDFTELTDGERMPFAAPAAGRISGFVMPAAAGDSLVWSIGGDCRADFYAADGQRLPVVEAADGDGRRVFRMQAVTEATYVLIHHASPVLRAMDVDCIRQQASGMLHAAAGWSCRVARQSLTVKTAKAGVLRVCDVAGYTVIVRRLEAGTACFALPPGIYLLAWDGVAVRKISVP